VRLLVALGLLVFATSAIAQSPPPLDCQREPIHFTSGSFELAGDLLEPRTGAPRGVIIYVWGAGPSNRQKHIDKSPVVRMFLDHGYAVFLYDKPGSDGSMGTIDNAHAFRDLAAILNDAVSLVKQRPELAGRAIGFYGSSQASYVMATALTRTREVAFVVAWSCPMQNSIEQGAYLVRNYVLCDGGTPEAACIADDAYRRRARARTYADYRAAATTLDSIPAIRDGLGWAGVAPETSFTPADTTSESFFDPGAAFASLEIPLLALYAENDRQIDPVQGAGMCRRFLAAKKNSLSAVEIIPGADHNMNVSARGCMQDQRDDYRSIGGKTLSPVFIETIARWLDRITAY